MTKNFLAQFKFLFSNQKREYFMKDTERSFSKFEITLVTTVINWVRCRERSFHLTQLITKP